MPVLRFIIGQSLKQDMKQSSDQRIAVCRRGLRKVFSDNLGPKLLYAQGNRIWIFLHGSRR